MESNSTRKKSIRELVMEDFDIGTYLLVKNAPLFKYIDNIITEVDIILFLSRINSKHFQGAIDMLPYKYVIDTFGVSGVSIEMIAKLCSIKKEDVFGVLREGPMGEYNELKLSTCIYMWNEFLKVLFFINTRESRNCLFIFTQFMEYVVIYTKKLEEIK